MQQYPTIILIRHGQTLWNVEGRYQGKMDSPLTHKGQEQAKENALKLERLLGSKREFKIISSPLGRAKESAFIICETLGISRNEIFFDERIQEFNYGIFEGKTKEECAKLYPTELSARESNKWSYLIEEGESYEMLTKRLNSWLESVQNEQLIVMIAHEMVNRALRGMYCHYNQEKILSLRQAHDLLIKLENRAEFLVT